MRTLEQAGTNICSMGYPNSNFKIAPSLFACAQKYTEQTAHCALVLPGTAGKGLTANDKFVIVDPDCRAHRSGQLELYFRSICSCVVVVGLCEVGNVVEHLQRALLEEHFLKERFQEEEKVLLGQNKTMTNLVTEWQKMLSASLQANMPTTDE